METKTRSRTKNSAKKFKSYYVVWKHAKGMSGFFAFGWFKSYYVVWKHGSGHGNSNRAIQSLNRTMQYGNTNMFP